MGTFGELDPSTTADEAVLMPVIHEQMNSCSCLILLLACIIYWQAREITRVANQCSPENDDLDLSLLKHVSPIEWENIVLYGQYLIDVNLIR